MNEPYATSLIEDWDETYRRSQLTLWVMLSLAHGEKYAAEIAQFMDEMTEGVLVVQEQSLYRALRRFRRMGLIEMRTGESVQGPMRKYYSLNALGRQVLRRFLSMHIVPLYGEIIKNTITSVIEEDCKNEQ